MRINIIPIIAFVNFKRAGSLIDYSVVICEHWEVGSHARLKIMWVVMIEDIIRDEVMTLRRKLDRLRHWLLDFDLSVADNQELLLYAAEFSLYFDIIIKIP